ncbi:aldehyde dehydrogenase family protein [Gryllotalpicola ginsengisoli]|uniref:aldehyde dehydrogenase family protein n=1 Tax=Gryllotalpicola ginsengisoli TaxID=444608 RepID=UPI0003B4F891|nr:aldehyde dehydrogenase family protein [Gryllotalpicola ginsengisoli]
MALEGVLTGLSAGAVIPFGGDRFTTVPPELAEAFRPGDQLHVVQTTGALLHVPAAVREAVTAQVDAAAEAFAQLRTIGDEPVRAFYTAFADALAVDAVWARIAEANAADVQRAGEQGRSTTRLRVSERMRADMVAGLRGWAHHLDERAAAGETPPLTRVEHEDWSVEIVAAPLGVIGFVFEGRPNVFADAAGVLATGNSAVLRIGGDALGTAQAIREHALEPALRSSGLPGGALSLIPVRERSAGWALFSDSRLALAVVRGSGAAVTELGSVARQSGIPVSAHGTGGAWLVADRAADTERFAGAVRHSLDRKVCNTLNVAVVVRERAAELVPVLLSAADEAAAARGGTARLHVVDSAASFLPEGEFAREIDVRRAEGVRREPRATPIAVEQLGTEWEWEDTPELSIAVVEDLDEAIRLFNAHSPQFVAALISADGDAHARFRAGVNAPFVGDGFTRWVDGQYALNQPELGLSNWQYGRLLGRGGVLTGADLTTRRTFAHHERSDQHR